MEVEYEATFININKDEVRDKLENVGAKLVKPEFLQKRVVFYMPEGHEINGGWMRVRDEQDKITMSLKIVDGNQIENQKEICLTIDSFEKGIDFLEKMGCKRKSYQKSKRELWKLGSVEICIDEWPFLEPYLEIEGTSEAGVKDVAQKLGFDYSEAIFGAVDVIYEKKYGITKEFINKIEKIVFDMENPFIK